jgi:hypothetical protein
VDITKESRKGESLGASTEMSLFCGFTCTCPVFAAAGRLVWLLCLLKAKKVVHQFDKSNFDNQVSYPTQTLKP